jgi:hypothetical protein
MRFNAASTEKSMIAFLMNTKKRYIAGPYSLNYAMSVSRSTVSLLIFLTEAGIFYYAYKSILAGDSFLEDS